MLVKQILQVLEEAAPFSYQENYDNSGLLIGDYEAEVKGILISLDCTEVIIDEAIQKNCNVVIAHHPIIFKGLRRITGENYVERTVLKAIRNDVHVIAIHTNLDNVLQGVNRKIAEKLGLKNCRILEPKIGILNKVICYVPQSHTDIVLKAMYAAGAGKIGEYYDCSFQMNGVGTFTPGKGANPFTGERGIPEKVDEMRVEVLVSSPKLQDVIKAMKQAHVYEEVAYEAIALQNNHQEVGSGMYGELPEALSAEDFFAHLKKSMDLIIIKHTRKIDRPIKQVALCGGSGSFLLQAAKRSGAQVFISSDFKYHEFFDAENDIIICDIGHYESERFTAEIIYEILKDNFTTFALHFSEQNTNPIQYI